MAAKTKSDPQEVYTYAEMFAYRAFEVSSWLLTLSEIQVGKYKNEEVFQSCSVLHANKTSTEEKRLAEAVVQNYQAFLDSSIRTSASETPLRIDASNAELLKKLENSLRLSCAEVGKLCDQSASWAQEQIVKGAGWKHGRNAKVVYWNKPWLQANAKHPIPNL